MYMVSLMMGTKSTWPSVKEATPSLWYVMTGGSSLKPMKSSVKQAVVVAFKSSVKITQNSLQNAVYVHDYSR